ncbi:MAG: protein-L-isoaspartate(D-aspartate) O-methyltransferase [Pseudomonadota bacterium]|nr:MAG: protein-L-isoaspartate(D-aspartate) O-methyltransferase [Pseudomonadota bacterium]
MKENIQGIGMTSLRTRSRLVERLREEGIRDARVLEAIARVPRHLFVDEALAHRAYEDTALPIGFGQTISQPYVVALMTQALLANNPRRVLEVGTGSGYQTAVLARLVPEVYSVERVDPLLKQARRHLRGRGHRNVHFRLADGSGGWPEHAPYDGILVTAAPAAVPPALIDQLAPGGRMIIPVGGSRGQDLLVVERDESGVKSERIEKVVFVPLVAGQT